jgi:hypothetical protein
MNIFRSSGENLGPDEKDPESHTVMVGCDTPFGGGSIPNFGGDSINGGGEAYDESIEQQKKNCESNPAVRQALNDADVKESINKALQKAHSAQGGIGFWEYGFRSSPSKSGSDVIAWPVGTDRSPDSIKPAAHQPWFFQPFVSGAERPNVFFHTHTGGPLSQADVNYAGKYRVSVVAVSRNGLIACYPK